MTTKVWDLVEDWRVHTAWQPKQAKLAEVLGVSRSAVSQWKTGAARPNPEHMRRIQTITGIPYRNLLDAMLTDMGYLPMWEAPSKDGDERAHTPPINEESTLKGEPNRPTRHFKPKREGSVQEAVEGSHKDSEKSPP